MSVLTITTLKKSYKRRGADFLFAKKKITTTKTTISILQSRDLLLPLLVHPVQDLNS
jgi:hypothetical protein